MESLSYSGRLGLLAEWNIDENRCAFLENHEVSICYLGKPYEVHTLDITGQIIEHYKSGHILPGGLEKARSIAMRGGYDFIEVYVDCCRAVSSNGLVSVISV